MLQAELRLLTKLNSFLKMKERQDVMEVLINLASAIIP